MKSKTSSKKRYIVWGLIFFSISVILFFVVIPFVVTFKRSLDKFDALGKINITDTSIVLRQDKFVAYNIQKNTIDTIRFKGIRLINYWATWCTPCIKEMPDLESLQKKYPQVQVSLFSNDSLHLLKEFNKNNHFELASYSVTDSTVFKFPQVYPTSYLLKDTVIVNTFYGSQNWSGKDFIHLLDSLLK